MNLILGITPETSWATVSVLFEHAGWVVSAENPEVCYQIGETSTAQRGPFLMLHSHPVEAIAHMIAKGMPPEKAGEVWLDAARAMVRFYKRNRNQTVMVYMDNLLADPEAQLAVIAMQFGLPDHDMPTTTLRVEQAPVLERIVASQLLKQAPGVSALLAQIEACTLPLAGHAYSAPVLDFDAVNRQLSSIRANQVDREELAQQLEQQAELRSLLAKATLESQQSKNESNLLLEQLHQVQEELEAKFIGNKQLQKQLVQLQAQRQTDQQAVQKAEKALLQTEKKLSGADIEHEKDLKRMREKLRSAEEANHKLEDKLEARFASHNQLQEQLVMIEARWQRDQQAKDHAEKVFQEAEHRRMKDKENLNEKLRSAEKANRKLESKLNVRQKQNNELSELRTQKGQALEAANQQIKRLQRELKDIRSSIAYKTTAPLRRLEARIRCRRENKVLEKPVELVRESGLFNEGWYLKNYPDVAESGMNPIVHYLKFGAKEHRNPSPEFDTDWYLASHKDVVEVDMNPLLHYIKFGQREGRLTNRNIQLPTLRAA